MARNWRAICSAGVLGEGHPATCQRLYLQTIERVGVEQNIALIAAGAELPEAECLDLRCHRRPTIAGRVGGVLVGKRADDGAEHLKPLPGLVAELPLLRELVKPLGP